MLRKVVWFNMTSHNLQSYATRASKVLLVLRQTPNISKLRVILQNPAYLESTGEAARLSIKRGVKTYATA